jgi:prophage regulatory protein
MNTCRAASKFSPFRTDEILNRLSVDAGSRTLGELIQERQLAVSEILRLQGLLRELAKDKICKPQARRDISVSGAVQTTSRELLALKEVCTLVALSRSTIYSLLKAEKFPPPVQVSARSVRWRRLEIDRWQSNLSARDKHG